MILNKNIFLVLISLLLVINSGNVNAQPDHRMHRFHEEKIKFFNDKLELSEKESDKFWPVYEDLQNRMMKIMEDERNLLTYYSNNIDALSDEEIDNTIAKFTEIQDNRHNLRSEYQDKFIKIIGKKKTMKMYALEREFRLYILRKFKSEKGRHENKRLP